MSKTTVFSRPKPWGKNTSLVSNTWFQTKGETNPKVLPVQLEEESNLRRSLTTKVRPGEPQGPASSEVARQEPPFQASSFCLAILALQVIASSSQAAYHHLSKLAPFCLALFALQVVLWPEASCIQAANHQPTISTNMSQVNHQVALLFFKRAMVPMFDGGFHIIPFSIKKRGNMEKLWNCSPMQRLGPRTSAIERPCRKVLAVAGPNAWCHRRVEARPGVGLGVNNSSRS